jgi:uncharacterized membrane protein YphA (DoxX/SURF4 family)
MKSSNRTGWLAVLARVLLGGWFIYSGGVKLFSSGLERFTRDIGNYKLVAPPFDAVAAYAVPWFEIMAGVCLIAGILRRGAILTLAGLVGVFAFCIGWAWVHQLDISCGWLWRRELQAGPGSWKQGHQDHGARPVAEKRA